MNCLCSLSILLCAPFFFPCWGLNSWPCTCGASSLPLIYGLSPSLPFLSAAPHCTVCFLHGLEICFSSDRDQAGPPTAATTRSILDHVPLGTCVRIFLWCIFQSISRDFFFKGQYFQFSFIGYWPAGDGKRVWKEKRKGSIKRDGVQGRVGAWRLFPCVSSENSSAHFSGSWCHETWRKDRVGMASTLLALHRCFHTFLREPKCPSALRLLTLAVSPPLIVFVICTLRFPTHAQKRLWEVPLSLLPLLFKFFYFYF